MKKIIKCLLCYTLSCSLLTACNTRDILTEEETVKSLAETDIEKLGHEFVFQESYDHAKKNSINKTMNAETIFLYLGDAKYYPVEIPETLDYVSDNSRYLYATDNSVSIVVSTCNEISELSSVACISNSEPYARNIIGTAKDSKSDLKEIAVYLDNNKAVVARTYGNEEAFNIISHGMSINKYAMTNFENLNNMYASREIPIYKKKDYIPVVTAGLGESSQKIYDMVDGTLTVTREIKKFEDVFEELAVQTAVAAQSDVTDVYYNNGSICYFEVGDYVAAIYNINFNTCYTCFGMGDEAKINVVDFLRSQ